MEVDSRGWRQVSAEVDGFRVFFSSPDAAFDANAEVFLSAFLIPAQEAGRGLQIDAPVLAGWQEGAAKIMAMVHGWWGHPPIAVTGSGVAELGTRASGEAVFFSGGVDAFHNLLFGGRCDAMVFVHGYDLWLSEKAAEVAREQEAHLRQIAQDRGVRAIMVRTNLRSHPLHRSTVWTHGHGCGLAAVGHGLRRELGSFRIASSHDDNFLNPWGTHPEMDHFWGAGMLSFTHMGAGIPRQEKIRLIADDPHARRSVRVCWQRLGSGMNCGRCEKCVRTMVLMEMEGVLQNFETMKPPAPLAQLVDGISGVKEDERSFWLSADSPASSPELRAACRRLLARCEKNIAREKSPFWRGLRKIRALFRRPFA